MVHLKIYKITIWKNIVFCFSFLIFSVMLLHTVVDPLLLSLNTVKPIQPFFQGDAQEPKVAFACNVFWGEEYLPEMLNALDEHNIKITFFIGGSWAKRFPQYVTELANRGHELGNHSYSHPHPNTLNKDQNKDQIIRTEKLIYDLTQKQTRLYAPPYGEYNDTVLYAAEELGYKTIMWSIDTIDWKRPPEEVIINRVIKKIHNGAIILIHPTASTAKSLPHLIKHLQILGYKISTVSDILN